LLLTLVFRITPISDVQTNPTPSEAPTSGSDKGFIRVTATITEALPAATFRAELENGHNVLAHLSGKMRMHRMKVLPGDKVTLEMSPYDLTKGRIVYRL